MTIGSYLYDGDGGSLPGEGALRSVELFSPAPAAAPAGSANACPVAVVDADLTTRSRLSMQLGGTAEPVPTMDVLAPRLNGAPLVLVVGPSTSADPRGVAAVERVVTAHPEVGVIMLVGELSTDVLQQALRSGVKDVLATPVDGAQLHAAVQRVAAGLAPSYGARPPGGQPDGGSDGLAKVVTVFSTKGGAGKSVLASNLAVVLARRATKPVVLVDADLQFGDAAVMLKLAPQRTIVDAVGSIDRLDAPFLQSLLVRHESSGLLVLPAPLEPAFADQIGASDMSRIVELLKTFCEYVVVDTPAYFNEVVLSLIEASDDVILVAGLDIPNIKNVKIGLQTLRLLNTPMDKIRLVLNRSNSKVKLDAGEVERTLQMKADAMVPSDVVVPQSVNKGVPVVLDAPKSGVAKAIVGLADLFSPVETPQKRRR
jgi:pilus assembly protein CpaE